MTDYVSILEDLKTALYVSLNGVQEQSEIDKALEMAIKALEQEPCDKCIYSTSRGYCQYDDIAETIPTEQEPKTDNRVKDELNRVKAELEQEPCEDCISRQAVLDVIKSLSNANPSYWNSCDVIDRECLIDDVEQLPSVTPQEPTGHWINNVNGTYTCDHCGCKHSRSNFCPNCGRRMIKERTVNADNNYSLRLRGERDDMTDEERKSCIGTIELLRRLAYNVHGVMDVIDADNCEKIIQLLKQEPSTGLDKITKDITKLKIAYTNKDKDTYRRACNDVLKIIEYIDKGSQ